MFQRHHRDYINKSATFNMSVTYKLRQRMDVSGGRGVGKTKFKKKLLKSRCTAPRSWLNCLVLCKVSALFVSDLFEELMKINVEYVEVILGELDKYFKKKKNSHHTGWSYGWRIKEP